MIKIAQVIAISTVLVGVAAGISTARAATPPAPTNDMTQGNGGGMMGGGMMGGGMTGGGGMMADHDKTTGKSGGDMMGMMNMMTSCSNLMTAQINMMNAMTNEINAQTKLLNQEAASGAGSAQK
ncbi:MAG TPA: hypothetical protein PLO16_14035 [Acidocella sp.]|nr:hypothetical protein [Acidocella sp.]